MGPRAVVLTLTLEEKATPALPQGCRHGLCQLRDRVRLEISVGPDGPSVQEELEELELARLVTDGQLTLFQTLWDISALVCHSLTIQLLSPFCASHVLAVERKMVLFALPH